MEHFVWSVDRVLLQLGPLELRWYSLLFLGGILVGNKMVPTFMKSEGRPHESAEPLLAYIVVGTIVGARLGHCLFYDPSYYLANPLEILKVWRGGLASHGGFTGVIIALLIFSRKYKDVSFFWLLDRVSIAAICAGAFIRVGNFFNSEILGRPSDVAWAVIFKHADKNPIPRHPTQLYEAAGYFAVSAILYGIYRASGRKGLEGRLFGAALILGYGFRFLIENFKEVQEKFEEGMALNMGQLLSIPMVAVGVIFLLGFHKKIPFLQFGFSDEQKAALKAS